MRNDHEPQRLPRAVLFLALGLSTLLGSSLAELLFARAARAQDTDERPRATSAASAEPAGYRELITEALMEYEQRHFEEARALFQQAHSLFPNARTMRGQGMAEFELRNYADAIDCLEAALASNVRPLDGVLRAETRDLVRRARRFVAALSLSVTPSTARVRVDGLTVELGPDSVLLLEVGEHTLEVDAPGYASHERSLVVRGGEEQRIEVSLTQQPGLMPRRDGGRRRFAAGPHLGQVAALSGYADETPGMSFDLGFWFESNAWALDTRLGVRFDLQHERRDYFHLPLEVAAYRSVPFFGHSLFFGAGTGLAYVYEHVETTQTIGSFVRTRTRSVIEDRVLAIPLFARVGGMLFRNSAASLVVSIDYGLNFAEFVERSYEQALRFQLGAVFGRSRR